MFKILSDVSITSLQIVTYLLIVCAQRQRSRDMSKEAYYVEFWVKLLVFISIFKFFFACNKTCIFYNKFL